MNIKDYIAIAGFVLSIINTSYIFIKNHKKLKMHIDRSAIKYYFSDKDHLIIHYQISNLSQLPISITQIKLIINNSSYTCNIHEEVVETATYKNPNRIIHEKISTNDVMPINLPALTSHSGFLSFPIPKGTLQGNEKSWIFQICTNRGKAFQKTFALCEDVLIR